MSEIFDQSEVAKEFRDFATHEGFYDMPFRFKMFCEGVLEYEAFCGLDSGDSVVCMSIGGQEGFVINDVVTPHDLFDLHETDITYFSFSVYPLGKRIIHKEWSQHKELEK